MAIKPVSLQDSTTYVSPYDPAVDEGSNWGDYAREWLRKPGCWKDLLKIKDGEQVTEFVIGVIPPAELNRINDECRTELGPDGKPIGIARNEEARWRCFLLGTRAINGWPGEKPPTREIGGVEYVDPAWLAKTFVRGLRKVALTVGYAAWSFNNLTEDEILNLS